MYGVSMSETVTSTARVRLSSPGRCGKRLAAHFAQTIDATWDSDGSKGLFKFPDATCDVIGTDGVLMFSVEGPRDGVEEAERQVATRLIHIANEVDVVVEWLRGGETVARFSRDSA